MMVKVRAEDAKDLLDIWEEHLKSICNSIHLSSPSPTGCSNAKFEQERDLASGGVFSLL